jgi:hypothetical protein
MKLEPLITLDAPPVVFVDACLESWIASVVGWCREMVASGLGGLATLPDEKPENRTRRPGGGRKKAIVGEPGLVDSVF